MCYKVVSRELFMIKYCLDRYKTHKMCDKAVNLCLPGLKFVLDWFVTSKLLEKLNNFISSNVNIAFANGYSDIVTVFNDDIHFVKSVYIRSYYGPLFSRIFPYSD